MEPLQIVEETPNIEEMERADVPAIFNAFRVEIDRLRHTAETITVTDVKDKAGMALANTTRLALWRISIAVEKRRKELKEVSLRRGQKIDACAAEISVPLDALIKRLKEQEAFAEREALRIEDETRKTRAAELSPFLTTGLSVDLGKISEDEYSAILAGMKAAHEAKIEAAKKAKEELFAKEKAEAEEREHIRLENVRLKQEAEEKEAAMAVERARVAEERRQEQAEAERKAEEARKKAEAEKARLKKEADAKLKAQQEQAEADRRKAEEDTRLERERLKAESDAREAVIATARAVAEKKAAEEAAARKKLENEKFAREQVEITAKKKAEAEARRAAAAPNVDKINDFADAIRAVKFPKLSGSTEVLAGEILEKQEAFARWIEAKAEGLTK